ncbi:kielin/chordin-like protein isoform X2 [Amphibalanus amphitrite]|uniref:kielin/chordin-like protein isoform X2 n=1 Tax=Amphibalanus amphitrite TaxID=1232801 RepID=UPI001C908E91|nr:kielin/chordin-like protein isoform X2 [Amphibalanus amphitrite]
MATAGVIRMAAVAAVIGVALSQDGLSCANNGQTWSHQCNTCTCRENVIVCTKDRCSGTDHRPITEASCLAGTKWKDACGNTCLCDPAGKRRCTVGSCPPRVRSDLSMTFIRTTGDACAAGDTWQVDCNNCSCQRGKAVCTTEKCPRRPPREPITCEPHEQWEDECGNRCECGAEGLVSCTMLPCEPSQRAGVRRRPILQSGDSCSNEGSRWKQDCNECDCVSGVVRCTRRLCPTGVQHDKYGKCQLNTRWVDECDNQCYCTDRGVPSCTLRECPYGRKEGVISHYLLDDGAPCSNEGERWEQGCSVCRCSSGLVRCSQRGCAELSQRAALRPEPEWLSCREETTWEDECGNICSCFLGGPLCTRMGCPEGRTAGKPVKFITFDGDVCTNEGESWKDDCNTCSCTNGLVKCTKKFCKKRRQNVRFISPFMAMTCTPGKRWIDECGNTCFCPDTGHSSCTMMACPPGKRPMVPVRYIMADGDTCSEEGSAWLHECNTCRCVERRVRCTKHRCHRLLRGTVLVARGSGTGQDKQCQKQTEWTDECGNSCRCSPGRRVMCTTNVCAPGKQAGRPVKKRPKLGEPCEDGSDAWLDGCNTCQCVYGVTACTRETCAPPEQEMHGVPVQQCRPDSSWLDECDNQCVCSEDGRSFCTLRSCPHGRQYGVPKKFVRAVNSTCTDEGATWRQDCNTCSCADGRVTCTENRCEAQAGIVARRGSRCVPGSKWTDQCLNTCRCTALGQPTCSSKACPPGKTAGVPIEQLPRAGDRCSDEGSSWKEDCNKCSCLDGVVTCSEHICTPTEANDEGPCRDGEEWIDECTNRCKCIGGEPRCTRRPCPAGGRPGVPVRFVVPDGETCSNEGERWQEDCNTCRCQDGRVVCSKEHCVGLARGGGKKKPGNCPYVPQGTLGVCINGCNGDDMCEGDEKCCSNGCGALCMKPDSCLEGISWTEDCNECDCLNGETVCTNNICAQEEIQFDQAWTALMGPAELPVFDADPLASECVEGSVWKKDCNFCDCVGGKAICTKRLCPSKAEDEVTGECREDSIWTQDCNRCRCIDGRAVCTMKLCDTQPSLKPEVDAVCRLPPEDPDKPKCFGFIRRWTFDPVRGKCRRYIFGGCHGTQNLFRTRRQCKKRCDPGSVQASGTAVCRLPVETGPCFDTIPRYFFDTDAGKCRQFGFSGCSENGNNFKTLEACITMCGGTYTSQDSHCDRRLCPWSLYEHYTEKGCEPVYDNDACCPTSFECPVLRQLGLEKCKYRGREYSHGDLVPEASELDPCKQSCRCVSTRQSGAHIDCAEVDCPAHVWNQISAGCVPFYLPDRCCPVSVQCSRRRRRSTSVLPPSQEVVCEVDGVTYLRGQEVPLLPDLDCVRCVCDGVLGRRGTVRCHRVQCPNAHSELTERGCVPVYSRGQCCPVDWKCPEDLSPEIRQPVELIIIGRMLSDEEVCTFGSHRVARGFSLRLNDRCTTCECVTPPTLTCHRIHCPKISSWWNLVQGAGGGLCRYRRPTPDACCPEVVCVAPVLRPPVLGPECAGKQCHLPVGREGCDAVYRAGECCPSLECRHPPAKQDPADELQCAPVECSSDCVVSRDQYGCPLCDCNATNVLPELRTAPPVCERQFCPVGCPSHYEGGCIVCECELKKGHPKKMTERDTRARSWLTTRPPCPAVTCRPHCGYKTDADGCTECDCEPVTTPEPRSGPACSTVTCPPHCGYRRTADGCSECDCPPTTTTPPPPTRPPCATVTCMPHCGYRRDSDGCLHCDCPPTTTPMPPTTPPCPMITCMPHCGYKRDSDGCLDCDCPQSTTPLPPTRPPCPMVTCMPHCGYKEDGRGCIVCDCFPITPTPTPPLTSSVSV